MRRKRPRQRQRHSSPYIEGPPGGAAESIASRLEAILGRLVESRVARVRRELAFRHPRRKVGPKLATILAQEPTTMGATLSYGVGQNT